MTTPTNLKTASVPQARDQRAQTVPLPALKIIERLSEALERPTVARKLNSILKKAFALEKTDLIITHITAAILQDEAKKLKLHKLLDKHFPDSQRVRAASDPIEPLSRGQSDLAMKAQTILKGLQHACQIDQNHYLLSWAQQQIKIQPKEGQSVQELITQLLDNLKTGDGRWNPGLVERIAIVFPEEEMKQAVLSSHGVFLGAEACQRLSASEVVALAQTEKKAPDFSSHTTDEHKILVRLMLEQPQQHTIAVAHQLRLRVLIDGNKEFDFFFLPKASNKEGALGYYSKVIFYNTSDGVLPRAPKNPQTTAAIVDCAQGAHLNSAKHEEFAKSLADSKVTTLQFKGESGLLPHYAQALQHMRVVWLELTSADSEKIFGCKFSNVEELVINSKSSSPLITCQQFLALLKNAPKLRRLVLKGGVLALGTTKGKLKLPLELLKIGISFAGKKPDTGASDFLTRIVQIPHLALNIQYPSVSGEIAPLPPELEDDQARATVRRRNETNFNEAQEILDCTYEKAHAQEAPAFKLFLERLSSPYREVLALHVNLWPGAFDPFLVGLAPKFYFSTKRFEGAASQAKDLHWLNQDTLAWNSAVLDRSIGYLLGTSEDFVQKPIRALDLSDAHLSSAQLRELIGELKGLEGLKVLRLTGNAFPEDCIDLLCELMQDISLLRCDISNNPLVPVAREPVPQKSPALPPLIGLFRQVKDAADLKGDTNEQLVDDGRHTYDNEEPIGVATGGFEGEVVIAQKEATDEELADVPSEDYADPCDQLLDDTYYALPQTNISADGKGNTNEQLVDNGGPTYDNEEYIEATPDVDETVFGFYKEAIIAQKAPTPPPRETNYEKLADVQKKNETTYEPLPQPNQKDVRAPAFERSQVLGTVSEMQGRESTPSNTPPCSPEPIYEEPATLSVADTARLCRILEALEQCPQMVAFNMSGCGWSDAMLPYLCRLHLSELGIGMPNCRPQTLQAIFKYLETSCVEHLYVPVTGELKKELNEWNLRRAKHFASLQSSA